jgi:large subunit ribosomal protein L23
MSAERLLQVIIAPHVSEKTAKANEKHNVYTFEIAPFATKPEVKKAVEQLFSTKVDCVRIVNVKAKTRRFRGIEGTKKKWKKAYVTLKEGQKIEFLGSEV